MKQFSRVEGVVSIRHSRESVDLEVLIGAYLGHGLNRSPVSEGGLSIVEPLVGQVLQVIGVDVRHAFRDLGLRNTSVKVEHLHADLLQGVGRTLDAHEFGIELVARANHLHVVEEVRLDRGKAHSAVVHLTSEHLVAEEVVAEDAAVGLGL